MSVHGSAGNQKSATTVHFTEGVCACREHPPPAITPLMSSRKPGLARDSNFVPLGSVLEDYSSDTNTRKCNSSNCCALRSYGKVMSSEPNASQCRSTSNDGFIQKRSQDNSCEYYVKSFPKSPSLHELVYEKVRVEQRDDPQCSASVKTRWPLSELTGELSPVEQKSRSSNVYDFLADSVEKTASHGRRKSKKSARRSKSKTYPKLQGVLDRDTGYIELKVREDSSRTKCTTTSSSVTSAPSSESQKGNNVWQNLPYADLGYLKRHDSGASLSPSSPPSEEEFLARASDLEMVYRYYIGHRTKAEAAQCVKQKPDSFCLYHRLPSKTTEPTELRNSIRLYLLYVSPTLKLKHYTVQKWPQKGNQVSRYSVSCDEKRDFASLNDLIRFYALNKKFKIKGSSGQRQRLPG